MKLKFRANILSLAVLVAVSFVLGTHVYQLNPQSTVNIGTGIGYWSNVCTTKIDGTTGESVPLGCTHNLFSTAGKNAVTDYLVSTSPRVDAPFFVITVCNGTQADNSYCGSEYTDCGLTRVNATSVRRNGTAGAWDIERVFTMSGCVGTRRANSTGLFNSTTNASSVYFAGNNFTNADLQNNDQLNITWSIVVS